MTSEIKDILENMTTAAPEMEDYIDFRLIDIK